MTGQIAPLGSRYVLTLKAVNCATGDSLAREQVEAESKEEVLAALGRAASNMRATTGCCWLKGISRDSVLAAC